MSRLQARFAELKEQNRAALVTFVTGGDPNYDTSLAILDALYNEFRDPNYAAMPTLRRMVAAGQLGRKTKSGFYTY